MARLRQQLGLLLSMPPHGYGDIERREESGNIYVEPLHTVKAPLVLLDAHRAFCLFNRRILLFQKIKSDFWADAGVDQCADWLVIRLTMKEHGSFRRFPILLHSERADARLFGKRRVSIAYPVTESRVGNVDIGKSILFATPIFQRREQAVAYSET